MTALIILTGLTAFGVVLIYTLFAPWWSTRSGRAVFALYWALLLLLGHFAMEAIYGQNPRWVEIVLISVLEAVLLWNGYTIASKQIRARRNHEEGH